MIQMSEIIVHVFSSPTCAPCNHIKPTLNELQEDYSTFTWKHINISKDPETARLFKVTTVPCMIITSGSNIIGSAKGAVAMPYFQLLKKALT